MLHYYSWWVGGGWVGQKKTKLMLYSTLVEIEVEVGVELGNCRWQAWHSSVPACSIFLYHFLRQYIFLFKCQVAQFALGRYLISSIQLDHLIRKIWVGQFNRLIKHDKQTFDHIRYVLCITLFGCSYCFPILTK